MKPSRSLSVSLSLSLSLFLSFVSLCVALFYNSARSSGGNILDAWPPRCSPSSLAAEMTKVGGKGPWVEGYGLWQRVIGLAGKAQVLILGGLGAKALAQFLHSPRDAYAYADPLRSRQWLLPAVVLRSRWSSRTRQPGRHLATSFVRSPAEPSRPFCVAADVQSLCPGANKVTELVTVIPDVAASSSFDVCAIEGKCRKECMFLCSQSKHWRSSGAVQDWSLMAF